MFKYLLPFNFIRNINEATMWALLGDYITFMDNFYFIYLLTLRTHSTSHGIFLFN
jgi:hypothetical protein